MIETQLKRYLPMFVIGTLFFIFGFVTWLNGSLIPFLQIACELSHFQAYLVTMAFYIAYVVMALPMSFILLRTGYKNGMVLGLILMVLGALIFIPAAEMRMYSIFLLALFVLGSGLTILQTAANPYIVMIGSRDTAAVRFAIMGLLNKAAGVIAPLVFTALVFENMSEFPEAGIAALNAADKDAALSELSAQLVFPYQLMAGLLVLLSLFVKCSPLPEPAGQYSSPPASEQKYDAEAVGDKEWRIVHCPQVILGAMALFFYVGAEVIAGDSIGLFGKGLGVTHFGQLTSYTMGFMVVGYVLGIFLIPRWISQEKALVISSLAGIGFTLLVLTSSVSSQSVWQSLFAWSGIPGVPDAVLFVALFGLANALVWPAIWPLALMDLSPENAATASALLIMSIAGGAILPVLYGALAEFGLDSQGAYALMMPCYLFILFYALKGHRMRRWPGRANGK